MKNDNVFRRLYPIAFLIIGCLPLAGTGFRSVWPTAELHTRSTEIAPQDIKPRVKSAFLKLKIINIEKKSNDIIEVTLQNRYEKAITAIAASVGQDRVYRSDYIYAELEPHQKLSPGASDKFLYSIYPGEDIVIHALVFSDLTSEGDQREVREILDKRFGVKMQLARVNPYLKRLGRVHSSLVREELQKLRRFVESLPTEKDGRFPMSEGLEYGLRDGRIFILKYLSKMNTEFENEKVQTFYQNNRAIIIRHSEYENFQKGLLRVERDFTSLESRL